MQLHQVKRTHSHKTSRQVGRGGKRGKTSGRGTKGQKARAGHKIRPEIRDVIMRLPKMRGYQFKTRFADSFPVSLTKIDTYFSNGDTVSPETLLQKGIISNFGGVTPVVKILSNGEITKKIMVKGCTLSAGARAKIEKAGGTIS